MLKTIVLTLLTLSLSTGALAQNLSRDQPRQPRGKWWKLSVIALVAASVIDAHSSWGHLEANPAISGSNGRFGTQSFAMKSALTGGLLGVQYLLLRKNPKAERYGAITNFAMSGMLGGAAAYNYRLHGGGANSVGVRSTPAGQVRPVPILKSIGDRTVR